MTRSDAAVPWLALIILSGALFAYGYAIGVSHGYDKGHAAGIELANELTPDCADCPVCPDEISITVEPEGDPDITPTEWPDNDDCQLEPAVIEPTSGPEPEQVKQALDDLRSKSAAIKKQVAAPVSRWFDLAGYYAENRLPIEALKEEIHGATLLEATEAHKDGRRATSKHVWKCQACFEGIDPRCSQCKGGGTITFDPEDDYESN